MKKKALFLYICVICVLLVGCSNNEKEDNIVLSNEDKTFDQKDNTSMDYGARKFSVWTTYWDTENIDLEFGIIEEYIENVSYFAAYFNEERKPFIPQSITDTYEMLDEKHEENKFGSYLTFVNDLEKSDGSSSLKDTELLYTLFSSEEAMENHIEEILSMTVSGGYDGIEIDYEAIRKDMDLWNLFIQFVEKLNQSALEKDIPVRVLLEPNIPAESLVFPQGPEYVVMCYNLYGYGTKPGPKTNQKFILETMEKMKSLPGKVNFAFATGGFDFAEDGSVEQVTSAAAVQLRKNYDVSSVRDEQSQSIVFTYIDKEGMSHEVWYSDKYTVGFWFGIVEEAGEYGLSLWRIGGNLTGR